MSFLKQRGVNTVLKKYGPSDGLLGGFVIPGFSKLYPFREEIYDYNAIFEI
jgi:hypothetical protein